MPIEESPASLSPAELVRQYYAQQARREWNRLIHDAYSRIEFDTTLHFLTKYLPSQGHILDAGGGPGRYTIELARQGYHLTLLDFTPENLAFARRQIKKAGLQPQVGEVIEGSIVDLSRFADASFDAVLCTGGPLSHVLSAADRQKAVAELVRVAKIGAPIFVSVISRLAVLVVDLLVAQFELVEPHFVPMRDIGDYFGGYGFTACHFFLPEELHAAFAVQPVKELEMVGLEGISSHHPRQINQLARNEARWKVWMETHYLTCTHPSAVGLSDHILIVCKKLREE